MTVFGERYVRYYDLLYGDKNYAEEASYLDRLIRERCPGAVSLLELGSGTGKHAELLVRKGYRIDGIERSDDMLGIALKAQDGERLRFFQGDIRSFRTDKTYDSAFALFHVISYLTANEDLIRMFRNVSGQLRKGGVFFFDCWYGPAVLTDRPVLRVKRFEDERSEVVRLSEPVLSAERNTVEVNYRIFVRDKESGIWTDFEESHSMRYLFTPEIAMLLDAAGMELETVMEFMSGKEADYDTWNVLYAGRKR